MGAIEAALFLLVICIGCVGDSVVDEKQTHLKTAFWI